MFEFVRTVTGSGSSGGSNENGTGDCQLLSVSKPPSQPQPCLHAVIPKRPVCTVQNTSNFSGYNPEYRRGKFQSIHPTHNTCNYILIYINMYTCMCVCWFFNLLFASTDL